jgi:drug/metabolite transporter (DMT)-like permease
MWDVSFIAPVVRYVYEMNPPIPGIVFSAGYYIIAAVALLGLEAFSTWSKQKESDSQILNTVHTSDLPKNGEEEEKLNSLAPILGGLELGTYLFIGNLLQVIGLKTIPADRAAFLVQLTTIFVPLLQAIVVGNLFAIPAKTWIACLIAFLGVVVMGLDGHDPSAMNGLVQAWDSLWGGQSYPVPIQSTFRFSLFTGGDFLVIAAALAYTMVRPTVGSIPFHKDSTTSITDPISFYAIG